MDSDSHSAALERVRRVLPDSLRKPTVVSLLRLSVAEDVDPQGSWAPGAFPPTENDITSRATVEADAELTGRLLAKEDGIIAGLPLARGLFALVDPELELEVVVEDGKRIESGETVARISGPARSLLTAERPALNVVGRLSGIATLTRQFVDAVSHTEADILDTRKTMPGGRLPDKYAVRKGGGKNHRLGLFDIVMVKDNHIDGAGGITEALRRVREEYGDDYPVEVEVKSLEELRLALEASPDVILLDNMDVAMLTRAVEQCEDSVLLEASGNVTLDTVEDIAETGVDRISVGSLTHSASTLDLSIRTG